jgi:hypothetical protein
VEWRYLDMSSRIETETLNAAQVWEAKLRCGDIIQFAGRTPDEIKHDGLRCPIHADKYPGFISPIFQEILTVRKVRIGRFCP